MPHESDLKHFLHAWPAEEPSPFLAARIIANATALPQRRPWPQRMLTAMTQSLTDWHYGLAYKSAALAFCLMLGLFTAQHMPNPVAAGKNGNAIGDMWTEEL